MFVPFCLSAVWCWAHSIGFQSFIAENICGKWQSYGGVKWDLQAKTKAMNWKLLQNSRDLGGGVRGWGDGCWPTKEFRNWIHKILCENTERCSLTGFSPVYISVAKHRDIIHHHDASVVSLGGFVFGFRSDLTECEEVTSTQHKSLQLNYTNEPLNVRTAFNLILKTCVGVIFSWVPRKNRGKKSNMVSR